MLTAREIADRHQQVLARIADAQRRGGRESEFVRLVIATKNQPPAALAAAFAAGASEFGENYVQEAIGKRSALDERNIRWHLIGHLQINKARVAAETFDLIQTLDNQRLASALFRFHPSPPMPVLIEVNLAGEVSKSGVIPEGAEALINMIRDQVDVRGLMAIPPPTADPVASRPYFSQLRKLRDRLASTTGLPLKELSMGMTDDFEAAILEGATMVRVGRAVFGDR
jgi:PLP dependent protein